jgi:hypothetical protein
VRQLQCREDRGAAQEVEHDEHRQQQEAAHCPRSGARGHSCIPGRPWPVLRGQPRSHTAMGTRGPLPTCQRSRGSAGAQPAPGCPTAGSSMTARRCPRPRGCLGRSCGTSCPRPP